MRRATLPLHLLLVLPLAGGASRLEAQQATTHQVAVTASVPVASPVGMGTRDLVFGQILPDPNVATTVAVIAAVHPVSGTVQSGEYRFDVTATHGVAFSVATPMELTAGPLPSLPVTFSGPDYGGWCVTEDGSGCTLAGFDPAAGDQRVCADELGDGSCDLSASFPAESILSVFIGGEITVPPTARAGTYAATITLTITQVY